jgi:peptidoglycan-N-acetylglucosamine deacetylase
VGSKVQESLRTGGVCLTFDDAHIEDWHAALPLFREYNARVTFFISGFHTLNPRQIALLHRIQADGHEIGYHTVNHVNAIEYLQTHSVEEYVETEIEPDLEAMRNSGFSTTAMAYPFNARTDVSDNAMSKYFSTLRTRTMDFEDALHELGETNLLRGLSMDLHFHGKQCPRIADDFIPAFEKASEEEKVLVTYAHGITDKVIESHKISREGLEYILYSINQNSLNYYTASELSP